MEFFQYKKGFTGGTELMAQLFHKRVAPYLNLSEVFNCILLPGRIDSPSYHSLLSEQKDLVLWLHSNPNEFLPPLNLEFFQSKQLHEKLQKVITVSEYASEILVEQSNIEKAKIEVIYNAIGEIPILPSKFGDSNTLKIIYISQPERGLEIAMKALHRRTKRFVFDIYGDVPREFLSTLPEGVASDDRLIFHGRRAHEEILIALAAAHIFVYPSMWYETFCVSLVEALAAGCITVYNSIGSLAEVGMGYGLGYEQLELSDKESHVAKLNGALDKAIELLELGNFDPSRQRQAVYERYSYENFIVSWFRIGSKLLENSR